MKKRYSALLIMAALAGSPLLAEAYDIDYASVDDIAGDTILLRYQTTDGYTFAECSRSGECGEKLFGEYIDSNRPDIFPSILNTADYVTSPDGTKAMVVLARLPGATHRVLYDVSGERAEYVSLLPHTAPAVRTSITYANDAVIFIGAEGTITRVDLDDWSVSSSQAGQTSFPFWSSSEHGNLVSFYNYAAGGQTVIDLRTDARTLFPSGKESYAVFNDSETSVAFLREAQGYNKLFVGPLSDPSQARDVNAGDYTVVEYEFLGDTLYYIANTESDPYEWNLYSFDQGTGEETIVDSNVAYDDGYTNLKKTHTALLYEKVDGTNKDVILFAPEASEPLVTLRASDVKDRDLSEEVERRSVTVAGTPGVILSPEDADDELPLIVWLHGGPMRQTSLGFHPFYGYAVYDEILERFAEEAIVLKLDYTGSWGHGNEHLEALKGHIGGRDVRDVLGAIEEMREEYDISDVHLFGPSYGGYLALRTLVEEPREIESVVSIAGVTDWTSLITRIPTSIFTRQFSGTPNAFNMDQYVRASVQAKLTDLDDQKMLLIYGEEDSTVPTWQSKEFYTYANALGTNVELVGYEEEGHTILERENLIDVCERAAEQFNLSESLCRD